MNKHKNSVRTLAIAAALGFAAATSSPVAFAQTANTAPVITQSTGTLTIHKYANPDTTGTPTGTEADKPATGTALEGVGFTIYKIDDIDLSTNDGLAKASGKKASDYVNGTTVTGATLVKTDTTDANGDIKLENLPIGAYLVVETAPLDGYSPAAPFIAFVPMTSSNAGTGGTEWNYDVHAYPKNYSNKAEKLVEDSNVNAGGTVTFTINSDVPPVAQNATSISKYVITDDLQENLVTTTADQIEVEGFTAGTDYTIAAIGADQKVEITFTAAGLQKLTDLKSADSNYKVKTTITATVLAPTDTGTLKNIATVISNNGSGGGDTTTETNETVSYWGNVVINKIDAADDAKLDGAVFKLFTPGDNNTCEAADNTSEQAVTANGVSEWTTVDGSVTIEGLHINDFEDNGATGSPDQAPVYCLFETKSPEGYELLAKPIELVLTQTGADEATTPVYTLTSEVKNLKDTTPNLPMTGGMGIGLLVGLGAAVVGAGMFFARRSAKN